MKACPHCGKPLNPMRVGVELTPMLAKIYDLIKWAGKDGIDSTALFQRSGMKSRSALRVNIAHLNKRLDAAGWKVVGSKSWYFYRLVRLSPLSDKPIVPPLNASVRLARSGPFTPAATPPGETSATKNAGS
jgi:hypothetical protein